MNRIKTALLAEVHWMLSYNVGKQANDVIKQSMGNYANCFAECKLAHGEYQWYSDLDGWHPYSTASLEAQLAIDELYAELKEKILSNNLPEDFIHVPNSDYVFYRIGEDDKISLLLTGWGFCNFRRPVGGGEIIQYPPERKGGKVKIGFINNGELVPSIKFRISKPNRYEQYETSSDGYFLLGDNIVYESQYGIVCELTNENFTLSVEKGKEVYEFEIHIPQVPIITSYTVKVVNQSGQPIPEYVLYIDGNQCTTNTMGYVSINDVQYAEGLSIKVNSTEGEPRYFSLYEKPEDNVFEFLVDEKSSTMVKVHLLDYEKEPLKNVEVFIETHTGKVISSMTDENGFAEFPVSEFENRKKFRVYFKINNKE